MSYIEQSLGPHERLIARAHLPWLYRVFAYLVLIGGAALAAGAFFVLQERFTINLGYVDLGHIDLLVAEKFYSNRTDFIRTAIRDQLERHAEATKQSVARKTLDLGLRHFTREDLEQARAAGQKLQIHVLGLASIANDVTPERRRSWPGRGREALGTGLMKVPNRTRGSVTKPT